MILFVALFAVGMLGLLYFGRQAPPLSSPYAVTTVLPRKAASPKDLVPLATLKIDTRPALPLTP